MNGWPLFRHAFLMLVRNIRMALQISVLPVLIFTLAFFLLDRISDDPGVADRERVPFDQPIQGLPDLEPGGILSFLVLLALGLTTAWIGVVWHRYILLGERAGLTLAKVGLVELGLYLFTCVKLLFLFTILAIPTVLLMVLIPAAGTGNLLFPLVLTGMLFFLGTVLPSAALGKRQRTKDALGAVRGDAGSIIVVTVLMVGFNSLIGQFIGLLGDHFFVGAVSLAATWLSVFLHLSIFTTIYGFYMEGRSLE